MQYFQHRKLNVMNDEHFEMYKSLYRSGKLRVGNPNFVRKESIKKK